MFLSKLAVDARSREFLRDYADIHDMHRTMMSAFPGLPDDPQARQTQGILWRLDEASAGFALYVQSRVEPDWTRLPAGYLTGPAHLRSLQPVLDAARPGRKLAFRIVANPTRAISPGPNIRGKRVAHRTPDRQIEWLARRGQAHGFVIPLAGNGQPDVAPSPRPGLTGRKSGQPGRIVVQPVRYDGHLVVTDAEAFADAVVNGIGRAKAYGCGLLSLAPSRSS